jgi:hypothetical protein
MQRREAETAQACEIEELPGGLARAQAGVALEKGDLVARAALRMTLPAPEAFRVAEDGGGGCARVFMEGAEGVLFGVPAEAELFHEAGQREAAFGFEGPGSYATKERRAGLETVDGRMHAETLQPIFFGKCRSGFSWRFVVLSTSARGSPVLDRV